MTLFIADYASYQDGLPLSELWKAGFGGINLKISHGITNRTVSTKAGDLAREARAAGKALSCFHWLTGDVSGLAQADYAYRRMGELGLNVAGVAHVVDVEGSTSSVGGEPTETIYRDYVARMAGLLRRPIATYTGDWWWTDPARRWARAEASPWLWAAPNAGYLPAYPGDDSPAWDAGYGGWESLAVMQYRVAPVAKINVSQSAVRSAHLWALMTGGETVAVLVPCLVALRTEFNEVAPNRDKGADGWIGNTDHAASSSDHNPDESGNTPYEDADNVDEVHALDVDSTGPWPDGKGGEAGGWFDNKIHSIAAREKVEYESPTIRGRLQNIIWRGKIISRSWGWDSWHDYTGESQHFDHAHFSARYESDTEADTRPWGVEGEDMTEAELLAALNKWATSSTGKANIARAFLTYDPGLDPATGKPYPGAIPNPDEAAAPTNPTVSPWWALNRAILASILGYENRDRLTAQDAKLNALATQVGGINAVDVQALGAAIAANLPEIDGGPTPDEIQEAAERAVREVFGDAATTDGPTA